jgi:ferredoxin
MNYINPTECIDCGACEAVCPVEAIRPGQRLDPEWVPFRDAAKELFLQIGNLGGSMKHPDPVPDPDFVKALPKQD